MRLLDEKKLVSKTEREELNILANLVCETWGRLQKKKVRRHESLTVETHRDMSEVFSYFQPFSHPKGCEAFECIYAISSTLYFSEVQKQLQFLRSSSAGKCTTIPLINSCNNKLTLLNLHFFWLQPQNWVS